MSRFYTFISLIAFIAAIPAAHVYAQQATETTETTTTSTVQTTNGPVTVEKRIITTTVPAAKETVETPVGYASCDTVPAGWENNVWIAEHRVCKYSSSTEGAAWIEGYWSCTKYTIETGTCTSWNWVSAHWVKTYSTY